MANCSREEWIWIKGEITAFKRKINDLHFEKKRLEKELQTVEKIAKNLRPNPCKGCDGYGKIREYVAPDESNVQDCKRCKGSGLSSGC